MRSARSLLLLLLLFGVAFPRGESLLKKIYSVAFPHCTTRPTYDERCKLPKEHYFYDFITKSCQVFLDYGCPWTRNSYDSLRKCEQTCSEIDICQLPPEHGPCDEKLQRWFYDPTIQSCEAFTFGGCEGNANLFETHQMCQQMCPKRDPFERTGFLDKRRRRTLDLIGTLSILWDKKTPAPPSG